MATFSDQLKKKVVKHHPDNQNVACALFNGSKKQALHKVALSIFNICFKNKITLLPEQVPRDSNVITDLASKDVNRDHFMLHPDISVGLVILWGSHAIDKFSSLHSRQFPRFNSHLAILVLKVLMLFLSGGMMRILGYSHLQNLSQESYNLWLFQKQRGL